MSKKFNIEALYLSALAKANPDDVIHHIKGDQGTSDILMCKEPALPHNSYYAGVVESTDMAPERVDLPARKIAQVAVELLNYENVKQYDKSRARNLILPTIKHFRRVLVVLFNEDIAIGAWHSLSANDLKKGIFVGKFAVVLKADGSGYEMTTKHYIIADSTNREIDFYLKRG